MISNASPLIVLAKVELIQKIVKMYKTIVVSSKVAEEIIIEGLRMNRQDAVLLNALKKEGKIQVTSLDKKHEGLSERIIKEYNLDQGEAETISLAMQLKNKEVLMDELLGRNVAKLFGLRAKGTLRVVLDLYKENQMNEKEVRTKVEEIIGKQFRLDAEILAKFWEMFEMIKIRKEGEQR